MNIDTGEIYKTREELKQALKDGRATKDNVVQGSEEAILALKAKLFPKKRRLRLK